MEFEDTVKVEENAGEVKGGGFGEIGPVDNQVDNKSEIQKCDVPIPPGDVVPGSVGLDSPVAPSVAVGNDIDSETNQKLDVLQELCREAINKVKDAKESTLTNVDCLRVDMEERVDNLSIATEKRIEVLNSRLDRISKELKGHFGIDL